jgi:hypothetical protein
MILTLESIKALGLGSADMYIAIAFVCLVTSECDFVVSRHAVSLTQCELQNARAHDYFEAAKEVSAYRTTCILMPETERRDGYKI